MSFPSPPRPSLGFKTNKFIDTVRLLIFLGLELKIWKLKLTNNTGWGEYLGYIDVTYSPTGKILAYNGAPIHLTNTTAQDPALQAQITEWRKPFEAFAAEEVGISEVNLDQTTCQLQECTPTPPLSPFPLSLSPFPQFPPKHIKKGKKPRAKKIMANAKHNRSPRRLHDRRNALLPPKPLNNRLLRPNKRRRNPLHNSHRTHHPRGNPHRFSLWKCHRRDCHQGTGAVGYA